MDYKDSLLYKFPDIAKEWDYEKNSLTPDLITAGSHKRVYWICPICKHSYVKAVCNRTSPSKRKTESSKCPICLGRTIIPGYNSLKALYPQIVESEWDYDKNIEDPDTLPPHKNKPKYWWKCIKGHSYQASINNKISGNGGNCPYCSHQRISLEQSLAEKNPQLTKEWHPTKNGTETPDKVFANSNKVYWWKCSICGFEWESNVTNRNLLLRGCPNCARGFQTSFPEQVIFYYIKQLFPDSINRYKLNGNTEIDIFVPSISLGIEYDGEYFHKDKLREEEKKNKELYNHGINLVRFRESNCPSMKDTYCHVIVFNYKSDYSEFQQVFSDFINDLCLKYKKTTVHIDIKAIENIIKNDIHTVPYEKSLLKLLEDKKNKGKQINAFWDYERNYPLIPRNVFAFSEHEVYWCCPNNPKHKWKAPVKSISIGYGCAYCSGRHHYTTEEWKEKATNVHGGQYDYSLVNYVNAKTLVSIICRRHGVFEQNPSEHLAGKGCKYCAGLFHEKDSIANVYPDILNEWDYEKNNETGVNPNNISIHSTRKIWWKCNNGCNHSYLATINDRVVKHSECAVCHGKQMAYDRSVEFLRPDLAKEWCEQNDIKPSEVSCGSEKKILWKCNNPCHEPYYASVYNRAHLGSGCPECSGNKKSHDTYLKEVQTKFPTISLLDKYQKSSIKVTCKCNMCGYIWQAFPYNLLKSKGCKQCLNKGLQ